MRTFKDILDKLYSALNIKSDIEFCRKYGIKKNTLSTWKARNKIPFELLIEISQNENLDLNWLLKDQPTEPTIQPDQKPSDLETICSYIKDLNETDRKKVLKYVLELQLGET